MMVTVVPVGNTKGIKLPKNLLKKLSIKDKIEMEEREDSIVLRPAKTSVRAGWKEAFAQMHERGEDVLEDIPDSANFDWEW